MDAAQFERQQSAARAARREAIARIIAAEKANFLKDPLGVRMPDELWQPFNKQAEAFFCLVCS